MRPSRGPASRWPSAPEPPLPRRGAGRAATFVTFVALIALAPAVSAVSAASPAPAATSSVPAPPAPPDPPAPIALEADERLVVPAADISSEAVLAVPSDAAGLFSTVADGVSFAEADDSDHVAAMPGHARASHRMSLSRAPSGNVVRATIYVRAAATGTDTTIQLRLFDRETLVAEGPRRPLLAAWGWVDLAEDFPVAFASSAANLRVEVAFDSGDEAAGAGRYSQLWVRAGLRVSLAFGRTGLMGGGTYTSVALAPSGRTIIAGSARGGLYRSPDAGATFAARNVALREPSLQRIASVVHHPTRRGTVYAVAGTRGRDSAIFRSTDDGRSWRVLTGVPQFSAVPGGGALRGKPLAVGRLIEAWDERDGRTWLWAATWNQGVMRSRDGGVTWRTVGLEGVPLRGLALDPEDPDRLFAATLGSGTWVTAAARARSARFAPVPGSPTDAEELAFVGDTLYVAGGTSGIFKLAAAGLVPINEGVPTGTATWTALAGYERAGIQVVFAACAPCQAEADGTTRSILRSMDGGASWQSVVGPEAVDARVVGTEEPWPLAAERPDLMPGGARFAAHQLAARGPARDEATGLVLVATEGGLWRSTDDGGTWRPAVQGLGGIPAQAISTDPRAGERVVVGLVGLGGALSADAMADVVHETWGGPLATSTEAPFATAIAFDAATTPSTVVVAVTRDTREPTGTILLSSDPLSGKPWRDTGFSRDVPGMRPTAVVAGHDTAGARVLLATAHPGGGIVRKVGDDRWQRVPPGGDDPYGDPDAIPRADLLWVEDSQVVFLFDPTRGVFRSDDAGLSWTLVWAQPSNQAGTGALAATPDGSVVFVATNIGVHRLDGAGAGSVADGSVTVTQLGTFRRAADVHLDGDGRLWVASAILHGSPARLALSWDPLTDEPSFQDLATLEYVNTAIRPDSMAVLDDGGVLIADGAAGVLRGTPSDVAVEPWFPRKIKLLSLRQGSGPESPLEPEDPAVTPALLDAFVLYVAPDGDDGASGLSEDEAVATLARAQDILQQRYGAGAASLDADVIVRVLSGTYVGQRTRWTFTHPTHIVKIAGYPSGTRATKPHFIGCATPSCPATQPWFLLDAARGEPSNLHLVNLAVSKYHRPLVLLGGSDIETGWNGFNVIHRMRFTNIGTRYRSDITPEVWSLGILILKNSRSNTVWHNRFEASSNRMAHTNPFFHVVYASRGASDNSFRANTIVDTSGDFHIRDRSDRNVFADNVIRGSFSAAIVTEWNGPGESESCETEISANVWRGDWECRRIPTDWQRTTPSSDGRCGRSGLRDFVVEVPNEHLPAGDRCDPR